MPDTQIFHMPMKLSLELMATICLYVFKTIFTKTV